MEKIRSYIEEFNPYGNLTLDGDFFEEEYLSYYNNYKDKLEELLKDNEWELFDKKVSALNDLEIYRVSREYLNREIDLKQYRIYIRKIKDIILVSEKGDKTKKHLKKIDKYVNKCIDDRNNRDGVIDKDIDVEKELVLEYCPNRDTFEGDTKELNSKINTLLEYYFNNYSNKMYSRRRRNILKWKDSIIERYTYDLGRIEYEESKSIELYNKYYTYKIENIDDYKIMLNDLYCEYDKIINNLEEIYSNKVLKIIKSKYEKVLNKIINEKKKDLDIFSYINKRIYDIKTEYIYDIYKIKNKDGSVERERFDECYRKYKNSIRKVNEEVRLFYTLKDSNRMVNLISRNADKYNTIILERYGMVVPKNPWFIRKYTWADIYNFTSDKGNYIRNIINKPWRKIVSLTSIKNKVIIEEEQELDRNRPYIFVSTHYFMDDVSGLFTSINRHAYMLMGTTDQIENNPLMMAGILFGFFHVDRMDSDDRKLCLEKQNNLIKRNVSFINYVAGSWENSENELQPLSFSGPYKTSVETGALIVPVASYLVRENNKIYMRFGEVLDLREMSLDEANEKIRDVLATMHYKQLDKYTVNKELDRDTYYDKHIAYMNQIGYEYWKQCWSKPFAKEEIGLRKKKEVNEDEVYSFIDRLSKEKLIELSSYLSGVMKEIEDRKKYDVVKYLDDNYEVFKRDYKKKTKSLKDIESYRNK